MRQTVKILAVSDVHGDIDKVDIGDAEVVIVAGDVGPDRTAAQKAKGISIEDASFAWAKSAKTVAWFKKHSGVRFYILPGNHDAFAKHHDMRKDVGLAWPENAKLINDKGYVDETGLTIWGMPWNPIHNGHKSKGGVFAADEAKILKKCAKISRQFKVLDILVTHAPPSVVELTGGEGGWHFSTELKNMLPKLNPSLLICGHSHNSSHVPVKINGGKTTVVNVAMKESHVLLGDGEKFSYKPRKITFAIERKVSFEMDMKCDMKQ